ncbi:Thiol-disulfide oxidoreductase ResA [Anaerolineales bacterium]|nr:Thiol-disulfide oxidoreductase ResA [Anaerolineales bacterium]
MTKKNRRRNKKNYRRLLSFIGVGIGLAALTLALVLAFGKKDTAESLTASTEVSDSSSSYSVTPGEVNYPAPELALQNVNGNKEALTDYDDKVVLVNNWATWCPPCKAEIPTLEEYYKVHSVDGFVIIGIEAGEPQAEVLDFIESAGITYPIWLDPRNSALRAFGNGNLPNSFVIDRKGIVRLAWVGEINREMLEEYVTPIIAEN